MKNKISKKRKKYNIFFVYIFILFIIIIILYLHFFFKIKNLNDDIFFKKLFNGEVYKILIKHHTFVNVWGKKIFYNHLCNNIYYLQKKKFKFEIENIQDLIDNFFLYKKIYEIDSILIFKKKEGYKIKKFLLYYLFFFVLTFFCGRFILRHLGKKVEESNSNQILNFGKYKTKNFYEKKNINFTFQDIAGLEIVKEEVQEIVKFLKNPIKYINIGGKIPKGVILIGPPGTGKTLLARALAGEAQVPFFALSGSDFVEMFIGIGASRVRDLFNQAKSKSPSIIFIDEIDAIGRTRSKNNYVNNDERENTLNQLLTEMDGFTPQTNLIVIAATNRPDILDKALLRPGRFDRIIFVDLPDLKERKEIFQVHIRKFLLSKNIDIYFLARQTSGFSGADIANICNEAALIAVRKDKTKIEHQDFLDAVDRIISGVEKKNKIIKFNEKRRIAYHEAGHAIISWILEFSSPLVKVTIIPRGKSLGSAWYLPEERQLSTFDQIKDQICALLAGRAAEQIIFGNISTGSLNDLESVAKQAKSIVIIFGLNKRIGNISYYDSTIEKEFTFNKPYSEATAYIIDEEISKIIEEQYQRSCIILKNNRKELINIANKLLEEEVIFKEDLEKIFGKRKILESKIDSFFIE